MMAQHLLLYVQSVSHQSSLYFVIFLFFLALYAHQRTHYAQHRFVPPQHHIFCLHKYTQAETLFVQLLVHNISLDIHQ